MAVRYYGAKRDSFDAWDYKKTYEYEYIPSQDTAIDLSQYVHEVYDQGDLGSCTANAICAAYGIDLEKQSQSSEEEFDYFPPSRLFLYYNTRARRGKEMEDTGASIRETIKAMKRRGICSENDWSYITSRFDRRPPDSCYEAAGGNYVCVYKKLQKDVDQLRACLNDECPFVFAFKTYDSFSHIDRTDRYTVQIPSEQERATEPYEYHAVVAVGYDDGSRCFKVLNSWGSDWGHHGYFYMPYEFIVADSLCYDFWKISFACQRGAPHPDENSSRRSNRGASGFVSINIRWDTQRQAVDLYTDNKNY